MQVSGSGPLGVLLMIAPLAAIPVFAIVGVPHFAPVAASGSDDDEFAVLGEPGPRAPAVTAPEPAPARSSNELYAPVAEPPQRAAKTQASLDQQRGPLGASAAAGRARGSQRWLPPSDALDQWEVRTDGADTAPSSRDDESVNSRAGTAAEGFEGLEGTAAEPDDGQVSAEDFNPDLLKPVRANQAMNRRVRGAADVPKELPAEQSGWQDAARRLKDLGIRKYRLESRIDEQNFVFTCALASPDNPQVVRRFEADADNPLEAVQQVLEQIDEWRSRNGADGHAETTD